MWSNAFKYLLVGALFWLVGAFFLGSSQNFVKRSEPVQLIVLKMDTRLDSDGYTFFRPVFGLETAVRPRPEYAGNTWMRPAPHQAGEVVSGRYDPNSGEMRSDHMDGRTVWIARIAKVLGLLVGLQGILMLFGVPELFMPLRVRLGR
ncbi:MAG: hypothetical protein WBN04_03610 [Paracoccaceae bacterium]